MTHLWGRDWTRREIEERFGDLSQVGGLTRVVHADGPGRGMRAIQVDTGSGLVFWVHPDRALDIPRATYRGVPIAWRTAPGDVAPGLTEQSGKSLLRALPGGLLFTGGLTHVGPPCAGADGEDLPLHGHVHSLPASDVGAWMEWEGDDCVMRVVGRVCQARLFGEKMELTRTITATLGKPGLMIEDTVRNAGFEPTPLMILHHMNFGAPLVGEECRIETTSSRVREQGADTDAEPMEWQRFPSPEAGVDERVFFHDAAPGDDGWAEAKIMNNTLASQGLRGIALRWSTAEEPRMWQWVYPGAGGYVLGLEPTNAVCGTGQRDALAAGQRVLAPGDSAHFAIEFSVLEA